jgi:hypothetical protein
MKLLKKRLSTTIVGVWSSKQSKNKNNVDLSTEINMKKMAMQPNDGKFIPHKDVKYSEDGESVTPEKAQKVVMDFLLSEIGPFVEFGFIKERQRLEELIDKEIDSIRIHVNNKIAKVTEEIIRDLKSSKIKEEIIKGVEDRLNHIKDNI